MSKFPSSFRRTEAVLWRLGMLTAALAGAVQILAQDSAPAAPPVTVKMSATPNFQQTDPAGGFAGNGSEFCAPVAVSNSLMELAQNGWPALLPDGASSKAAQIALIKQLASPDYMDTSLTDGTNVGSLIKGLQKLVGQTPYRVGYIKYEGFRKCPAEYGAGALPDPAWIERGVRDPNGAVWLNVGWYRYDQASDTYNRVGGHWVTMVGYEPGTLVIHNPWQQTGRKTANDFVAMQEIQSGTLVNAGQTQLQGLPRAAKGYYLLTGNIRPKRGTDTVILDGAVVMSLQK